MKKYLFISMLFMLAGATTANAAVDITKEHFPDDVFRGFVTGYDADGDGVLSDEELNNITKLAIHYQQIADLTGIQYLTALTTLDCTGNQLTELDLTKNTQLVSVSCESNQLRSLSIAPDGQLRNLNCARNQLTSLDLSATSLRELACGNNQLTTLTVDAALETLLCSGNLLSSLDLSACHQLTTLYCEDNRLQTLVLPEKQTMLKDAHLLRNQLRGEAMTALVERLETLPQTTYKILYVLDLDDLNEGNVITTEQVAIATAKNWGLNAYSESFGGGSGGWKAFAGVGPDDIAIDAVNFPDEVFRSYVKENLDTQKTNSLSPDEIAAATNIVLNGSGTIATLKGLEHFTALKQFSCEGCGLTSLDVAKNTALFSLTCSNNQLTALDVSGCPSLRHLVCKGNNLEELSLTANTTLYSLDCSHNRLKSLSVAANGALSDLRIQVNQLDASAMDAFLQSLPKRQEWGSILLLDLNDASEGNSLTPEHLDMATAKMWHFLVRANGITRQINTYDEFTGIEHIQPDGVPTTFYTLDGKKLQGLPRHKGIYIVNGRKVIKM